MDIGETEKVVEVQPVREPVPAPFEQPEREREFDPVEPEKVPA